MRRRTQHGNCGVMLLVVVVILLGLSAWLVVASTSGDDERCEELRRWFQANPYDTNPDLNRDYRLCQ